MSITVNNLSKIYNTQKAVDHISFTVNKGEIVGFLGPNGAGKSTTMKMITGYLQPNAGEAKVCDILVTENNKQTKNKIGYLPEANPLYADMYVREYLSFIAGIYQIEDKKLAVEKSIQTVGLSLEANKKINQLSKGYKQRVGLAAALIHDPEVLILDEPTSGLDPNQIIEIREVIKKLGENKTVLFSSHILQEVEAICDRVIIINKGKIVANDTLQNLQQTNSTSSQTISIQFKEMVSKNILEKIPNVISVNQISESEFQIETNKTEQVQKSLLQFAIEQNLNIISLQTNSNSLEELFKNLTK